MYIDALGFYLFGYSTFLNANATYVPISRVHALITESSETQVFLSLNLLCVLTQCISSYSILSNNFS